MGRRIEIPKPCSRKWVEFKGDGRERVCETCQTGVHAIAEYSPEEWDRLWQESGGRVCGMLAEESPAEPRSRRAVLVGALLSIASPLLAQTGRVRFTVVDQTDARIVGARVSLLDKDDKAVVTLTANQVGEVEWMDLPMGTVRFEMRQNGFKTKPVVLTIQSSAEMRVKVVLEVGDTVEGGVLMPDKR